MTNATIIGAGPVGLSLALMRAQAGAHISIVDKTDATTVAQDPRSLAISYGSMQTLQGLGLDIKRMTHAPIQHIHISEQNAWGHTQLHHDEVGVPMLGLVVRYGDLLAQLTQLAQQRPNISLIRPAKIVHINEPQVVLDNGQILNSELIVHAEGLAQNDAPVRDYQQTALISNVTLRTPKPAWAWERFTAQGPCALLPMSNDGLVFNLVWCMDNETAQALNTASDVEFLTRLNASVAHLTGRITTATPRTAFALCLKRPADLHSTSRIAIGNAAQTIHPVAGQGFNLGLRDAFILNQTLNQHNNIAQAINIFNHHRRIDRAATTGITDQLARGFFNDFGAHHLRSAGFGLINTLPFAKKKLAEQFIWGVR